MSNLGRVPMSARELQLVVDIELLSGKQVKGGRDTDQFVCWIEVNKNIVLAIGRTREDALTALVALVKERYDRDHGK
jgi:hypothetical protein